MSIYKMKKEELVKECQRKLKMKKSECNDKTVIELRKMIRNTPKESINPPSGKVYIHKLRKRCVGKDPVFPDVKNINVTSGSNNKIYGVSIKELSPMYLGPVDEKKIFGKGSLKAEIFENYWQYGKIFKELGHIDDENNVTEKWKQFRDKGYQKRKGDRHPSGTKTNQIRYTDCNGKNWYKYLIAISSHYLGQNMDYIESRKKIYVPVYEYLIKKSNAIQALKQYIREGHSVQILDLDGPDAPKDEQQLVTVKFLKEKINDPNHPFGHGYIVAALLAGITHEQYTM